jgi:hypothetical protein
MLGADSLDRSIQAAVQAKAQGTLLVVHTLSALRKWLVRIALMKTEFQYSFGLPRDYRAFNTLCAAPSFASVPGICGAGGRPRVRYARIALLDGTLHHEELAAWRALYPEAEMLVNSDASDLALRTMLHGNVPDDETIRGVYKALRGLPAGLTELACKSNAAEPAACVALHVLRELQLIEWQPEPWRIVVPPPHKCSLEDRALLRALRAAAP